MFLSFCLAAVKKLTPLTCYNFLLLKGVFLISVAMALSVLSITLAIISSWLCSSWLVNIVGGASLGEVTSVLSCVLLVDLHCEFCLGLHIFARL